MMQTVAPLFAAAFSVQRSTFTSDATFITQRSPSRHFDLHAWLVPVPGGPEVRTRASTLQRQRTSPEVTTGIGPPPGCNNKTCMGIFVMLKSRDNTIVSQAAQIVRAKAWIWVGTSVATIREWFALARG